MKKPHAPPDFHPSLQRADELANLSTRPEYVEMLRRCESGYWPWAKLQFAARGKQLDPEILWMLTRASRQSRCRVLPLFGDHAAPLRFNTPDRLQHEVMLIDQQLAGGRMTAEDSLPSVSQRESFIISALQEEAIASSMLEGAVTTRRQAREMLSTGRRPHTRGEQMVYNNYQAIQFIRENRTADLSVEFLLELQTILTGKTLDASDQVGRFRTAEDPIHIVDERDGEILHVPPPAGELSGRLRALCAFANRPTNEKEFIHPVIAASVLHFQLGFDHLFCDGNGRTARALFYWMMLRSGYWLFEYLPISRLIYRAPARYARAFLYCETDCFDITYFLMYKARIIEQARHDLRKYIAQHQQQMSQTKSLFSSDSRLNHRQRELVSAITRNPGRYFTIAEHQHRQGVSYATARKDLLQLAEWNYLKRVSAGKRFDFITGEKLSDLK